MNELLKTSVIQATRFGVVGVANVIINAAIYSLLVYLGVHYIVASAVGTIAGIMNSYIWSKFYVFRRKGNATKQLFRTILVYSVQISVSWLGLAIMIELLGLDPYSAYAANIVIVTSVSFLGLKYFAFRPDNVAKVETKQ